MAVTPQEAAQAQLDASVAYMRRWETHIDALLNSGQRTFHFVNAELLTYLPILIERYRLHGWDVVRNTTDESSSRVFNLQFTPRPVELESDEHQEGTA